MGKGKSKIIRNYILENPPRVGDRGYYKRVALLYGYEAESVRKICEELGVSNIVKNSQSKRFVENTKPSKVVEKTARIEEGETQKWLILPDVHRPFHNEVLWQKVLELIKNENFYGIILNGDYLDMLTMSGYVSDSLESLRHITLEDEYRDGRKGLDELYQAIGSRPIKKVYMYGNHEARFFTEIKKGDRGKYGKALLNPTEGLKLLENGWEVFTDWTEDSYRLGNHLEVIHGVYCPIHAAKQHLDKFEGSVLFGHTHRIQTYGSGTRIAYNIGWLGDNKNPVFRYAPKPQRMTWMNGFATVDVDRSGYFWVQTVNCFNDHFLYNNKLY